MPRAPAPTSSAGWPMNTSVPLQRSFRPTSTRAVPIQTGHVNVMAAGVHDADFLIALVAHADLAGVGQAVRSVTGRASMSVRTSTVGPGPFLKTPTMPWPPTFSVTSKPRAAQLLGQTGRGLLLVVGQLGMAV